MDDKVELSKKRLAFAMEHANDLWQADTMFGPHINNNGRMTQTKLIAFIDDASRVICHARFFFNENIEALVSSLKSAFYKRGIPKQLYVDNGSIYCSQEITLICARVGCILRHTPVRDGVARGKIERFFRGLRDRFLAKVKKNNTFSFKNERYEQDADLRNKTITIRFDRNRLDRIIVYYNIQRIGIAEKLNLVANSKIKRGVR